MKKLVYIALGFVFAIMAPITLRAQSSGSPAPYCSGNYSSGNCNQGGPSNSPGNNVNDFINTFITSGGSDNISNVNSGCNAGPGNYQSYCGTYLSVQPGQVITCTVQSGITFAQGFAIFIDWNQDNTFNVPSERVAATPNVPPAASFNILTFTVPAGQPNGMYRIRVRCAFAQPGTGITPCGQFSHGETEDYNLYVGPIPPNSGVITATATGNATICPGQSINLGVTATPATVSFTWTGPNNFVSTQQNPVITNALPAASGVYTVLTSGGCPASKTVTVAVAPDPSFSINPTSLTICQNNNFPARVVFNNVMANVNHFNYSWTCNVPPGVFVPGGPGAGIFSPGTYSTIIGPGTIIPPQVNLIYTVVVSPTITSCPVTHTMNLTINNPVTPTLTIPAMVCNSSPSATLTATPGGGTWSAVPAANFMNGNGVFTPSLVANAPSTVTVMYSVNVGTCTVNNTGTISVSKFNTPALIANPSTMCSTLEPQFDLMTIVQSTVNGSWRDTLYVSNDHFDPTGLPTGNYAMTYSTLSSPAALNICPAHTVLIIPVFKPTPPVITPIPEKCNNAPNLQLTANPTLNLLWTGNTGVSSTGVLTPSSAAIGFNTITCTGGLGTCVASYTTSFIISEFRTAAFSGTVPNLCVNSNPFNLLSITQNTNGTWSGLANAAQNTNPVTSLFTPASPLPLATGNYTLNYTNPSFPNQALCPQSNTILVSVLNPPTANIVQAGPFCNNQGPVQLIAIPNLGVWTPSSYLTSGGLFTPSLSAVGNSFVQYVIGTSTCNTQQTASISVEGFVPAAISSSISDQCTTNSPVNLLPYTLSNMGTWSGPGITGASFDPGVTGTGHIILTYNTASSPSGLCPDQATVAVNVYSLATPVFNRINPLCNSAAPFKLGVSPVGGIFGGANNTAVNREGVFNPATAVIGNNMVNYSITSGPCVAYAQGTVAIERFIPADFIKEAGPYCRNDQKFARNMNEFVQNPGGEWVGPGITGSMFTFTNANIGDNNIITYRTHSLPTATLCPDTSNIRIKVYDTPQAVALSNAYQGCTPFQVVLNTPSFNNGSGVGVWDFGDGSDPSPELSTTHIYNTAGSYSVTFNYSVMVASDFACSAQARLINPIKIYDTPKADFNVPDAVLISEPEVQFTNTSDSQDRTRFQWTISSLNTTEKTSYEINPAITFPQVGEYKVKLSATSLNGCKTEVTKVVSVRSEFNVFIPTSFTPNGDGINDYFFPVFTEYGLSENSYELSIFTRWGDQLFHTKEKSNGWDGKKSGDILKQDVYVYKLKFKDVDGNVYNKTGYVSLLR